MESKFGECRLSAGEWRKDKIKKIISKTFDFIIYRIKTMKIKGIKRGKTIEIFQEINIPDGQEIEMEIPYTESTIIMSEESGLWQSLENFRQAEDLEKMGIESDIFADVRDSSPGREVVW
jgi:hypothetical protein